MIDTFNDMARQARHGKALEKLAAEYGIKPDDLDRLMTTVLPLFSLSLRNKMADPAALASFFEQAQRFQSMMPNSGAVPPAFQELSRQIMDTLTGSAQSTAAALERIQALTGYSNEAVAKFVPSLFGVWASLLTPPARQKAATDNPFLPMLDEWQKFWKLPGQPVASGSGNPFLDAFLAAMTPYSGSGGASKATGRPAEKPSGPAAEPAPSDGLDVIDNWRKLFASGLEIQESQRKAWEGFFEQFGGNTKQDPVRK